MSVIDRLIKVENNVRPCVVGINTKAMFHKWHGHFAIVEYEDGSVDTVFAKRVRFLDSKRFFEGCSWDDVDDK